MCAAGVSMPRAGGRVSFVSCDEVAEDVAAKGAQRADLLVAGS